MNRQEAIEILGTHRGEIAAMGVESLAIFGSVARNEASANSDVDILVEFKKDASVGLFRFVEIKQFLEGILHHTVDLGTLDTLRAPIREQAMREAVHVA